MLCTSIQSPVNCAIVVGIEILMNPMHEFPPVLDAELLPELLSRPVEVDSLEVSSGPVDVEAADELFSAVPIVVALPDELLSPTINPVVSLSIDDASVPSEEVPCGPPDMLVGEPDVLVGAS